MGPLPKLGSPLWRAPSPWGAGSLIALGFEQRGSNRSAADGPFGCRADGRPGRSAPPFIPTCFPAWRAGGAHSGSREAGRVLGTMAVRSKRASRAALAHVAMVLLLAAAFPARAREFPADAPLAGREPAPGAEGDAGWEAALECQEEEPPRRHIWLALGEVTAVNAAVWSVNRFIRKRDWANVSPEVWGRNLTSGFEWDADKFTANQLDHPYHGGIYYNIGRDNGLSYWEAAPLTFFGSLQWEVFGENNRPSTNDIINTSLGGLAVGEVLYRLSSMILDNGATGWERGGREVAAGLLNPGRGFSRVVRGEAWRVGPTPREWTPAHFAG
ncbi:DUF3943 domain-containing protein, partial [Corallococcus exercitus]